RTHRRGRRRRRTRRGARRPDARARPRPRGDPADARPARLGLPLPRRGARAARGEGPARRAAPRPAIPPHPRGATWPGPPAGGAERGAAPADRTLGLVRARAATLLMLALPGSAYLYQGEELGLPEVIDLPDERRQDPRFHRTGGASLGRDGCRVPLPWSGHRP